jgi:hypothetical protein
MLTLPSRRILSAVVVTACLADAGPAWSRSDFSCHKAISRSVTRYQAAALESLVHCHGERSSGQKPLATDCNDVGTADLAGSLAEERQKRADRIRRACSASTPDLFARYPRCPAPTAASDDAGVTTGIDDVDELAECLVALSEDWIERLATGALGSPAAVLSSPHLDCQSAIGEETVRVLRTASKSRARCQRKQENALGELDYDDCAGPAGDSDGRIADALTSLRSRIASACDFNDGHVLGACGYDAASLETCVHDRIVEPLAGGLVAASLETPVTCPARAQLTIRSAGGPALASSGLDLGYLGTAHGMDVVDGFRVNVKLDDCNADCEDCQVSLDREAGACRCDSDSTIECSTVSGPDDACAGGMCHCSFGPPRPEHANGAPLCVIDRHQAGLSGSAAADGSFEIALELDSRVHVGPAQPRPCPVCDEDSIAGDGIADGECRGGPRNGLPCDAGGTHATFGSTSLDCMPEPGSRISGGLVRRLTLSTDSASLTAAIGNPAHCASGVCHCSYCSGDTSAACSLDAECAALGKGTCGAALTSNPSENVCTGGSANCADDGTGSGRCSSGPVDRFCDAFTEWDGRGLVPCVTNGDCNSNDCDGNGISSPGECGTCSLSVNRACFLPTIASHGTRGVFQARAGAVFCVPNSEPPPLFNFGSHGYPGPGRLQLDFDVDYYCEDGSTRFELPGGSSCP